MSKTKLPAMSERDWQAQVCQTARVLGWLVFHAYDSRRSAAGFPDLCLVHPRQRRVVFAELKRDDGTLRPDQKLWLDALGEARQEVHVWRPQHWPAVLRVLRGDVS